MTLSKQSTKKYLQWFMPRILLPLLQPVPAEGLQKTTLFQTACMVRAFTGGPDSVWFLPTLSTGPRYLRARLVPAHCKALRRGPCSLEAGFT